MLGLKLHHVSKRGHRYINGLSFCIVSKGDSTPIIANILIDLYGRSSQSRYFENFMMSVKTVRPTPIRKECHVQNRATNYDNKRNYQNLRQTVKPPSNITWIFIVLSYHFRCESTATKPLTRHLQCWYVASGVRKVRSGNQFTLANVKCNQTNALYISR